MQLALLEKKWYSFNILLILETNFRSYVVSVPNTKHKTCIPATLPSIQHKKVSPDSLTIKRHFLVSNYSRYTRYLLILISFLVFLLLHNLLLCI